MTRRRFYASPDAFAPDASTLGLGEEQARHLRDVLRLGRGAEVFVFDGEGREFRCVVEEYGRDTATLRVLSNVEPARSESPLHLTIAVALLKGEKLDLVVQKATELGATRIVPVVSKLADVRLRNEADSERRVARLTRIAIEACKQSGRARVPQVESPIEIAALIETTCIVSEEWRVMFSERDGRGLIETIESLPLRPAAVTALIGSEGGWTDEEIAAAKRAGWSVVTLAGRTLRAETAAISVTALLQHMFGDLK